MKPDNASKKDGCANNGCGVLPNALPSLRSGLTERSQPFSIAPPRDSDCRGMILAATLVVLGVVAAIVMHSQVVARLTLRQAERRLVTAKLLAAATDAAWSALHELAEDADLMITHTNEAWALPARASLPNGIETLVVVADEQRLFDVNNLSVPLPGGAARPAKDIAAELLETAGGPRLRERARDLGNWFREGVIDGDNGPSSTGIVQSPAELGRILGLAANLTDIQALLTALPHERARPVPVNINTAAPEVLQAVIGGRDRAPVQAIVRLRDAHPLGSVTRIADIIGKERFEACRPYLDVKSRFFYIHALAEMNGNSEEIYALARRDERGQVEILRWLTR